MSSPLALGAVSAVLRNLLDNGMVDVSGTLGPVNVSVLAPDLIKLDKPEAGPQINLFLHQVTHNAAWRNRELPSRSGAGDRITNPPLALDLHYLVTAYASADVTAEILLGYAMYVLHEVPMLDRAGIRRALDPSPLDVSMLPPALQALAASDLADQFETLRITPVPMPMDDMSKLWSAIQTHYRPSVAYQVSVVLIEARQPARSALPVLSRGPWDALAARDRGVVVQADMLPPGPALETVTPPNKQGAARLGDKVGVRGIRLDGSHVRARLRHRLLAAPLDFTATVEAGGRDASFQLPADAAAQSALLAGLFQLSFVLTPAGDSEERESNAIALAIAPDPVITADAVLGLPAIALVRAGAPPQVTVTLAARPQVRPEQQTLLALGSATAVGAGRTLATDPLVFVFPASLAAGGQRLRLRVDGVDSLLVDKAALPPRFDPSQQATVPP
ncbi:MAG: DUF4255 domain-containing protein [Burkholderiales bacterium]|nr:DUF4255 domain-containing protein [Burkholderiales bacterium]